MTTNLRRWHVFSTATVILLAVVSTLSGLLWEGHYQDAPGQVHLYQIQDVTILAVGVPVLAVGLVFARRNSLRGRLVWLGGLAYMTYIWASVGLQVAFNTFFLLYVMLFSLSLITFIGGLVTTDADTVRQSLRGRISPTIYSGFLLLIAGGLAALWLSEIIPAILAGSTPLIVEEFGPQALVSHFIDLAVVVPSLLIAGVWLWWERAWGYVFAGVVLVLGATLAVTISAMTLGILSGDVITVSPGAIAFTFIPILISAGLAINYIASIDEGVRDREPNELR